ncbi:metal ABC transporter permease [Candidatus Omnitrophota bacterium]
MFELLQYGFVQNALLAALLASIACGIVGSYIVVRRIVFIAGGIAHASFGGIGLGYFLGINPMLALIPFSLLSAMGMGALVKRTRYTEDAAIGVFWSVGMAVGIIFIGLTPGYAPDLFGYLFGNILMVSSFDVIVMAVLDCIILLVVGLFYKEFLALCFDEDHALASGLKVNFFYSLLLMLIALTVVILVKVVGIILVITLITIPAALSQRGAVDLKAMMWGSICWSLFFTFGGIALSFVFDLAPGAIIIMLASTIFVFSSLFKKIIIAVKKEGSCCEK